MRKTAYVIVMFCAGVILAAVFDSCKRATPVQESAPIAVSVLVVDSVSGGHMHTFVGTVEENVSVALSFPAGGRVERVYVHEGEFVRAG